MPKRVVMVDCELFRPVHGGEGICRVALACPGRLVEQGEPYSDPPVGHSWHILLALQGPLGPTYDSIMASARLSSRKIGSCQPRPVAFSAPERGPMRASANSLLAAEAATP